VFAAALVSRQEEVGRGIPAHVRRRRVTVPSAPARHVGVAGPEVRREASSSVVRGPPPAAAGRGRRRRARQGLADVPARLLVVELSAALAVGPKEVRGRDAGRQGAVAIRDAVPLPPEGEPGRLGVEGDEAAPPLPAGV